MDNGVIGRKRRMLRWKTTGGRRKTRRVIHFAVGLVNGYINHSIQRRQLRA